MVPVIAALTPLLAANQDKKLAVTFYFDTKTEEPKEEKPKKRHREGKRHQGQRQIIKRTQMQEHPTILDDPVVRKDQKGLRKWRIKESDDWPSEPEERPEQRRRRRRFRHY
jgi:hypothetical protein